MERLTITMETGNDDCLTRDETLRKIRQYSYAIAKAGKDSGILRDINGNKIGGWKWEPVEE